MYTNEVMIGFPFMLFGLIGLATFLMFIIALVQVLSATFHDSTNKVLWAVVILFAPFLGPILWWCIGTRQRVSQ